MPRASRSPVIFRFAIIGGILFALLVVFLLLLGEVCCDVASICENTGSRKGYREWFLGTRTLYLGKTGVWYQQSELERFMKAKHPAVLQYRWTSHMGTGRNILGMVISRGHGRPGPILNFSPELLDECVRRLDDAEKKALYDDFSSGNRQRIERAVEKVLCFDPLEDER